MVWESVKYKLEELGSYGKELWLLIEGERSVVEKVKIMFGGANAVGVICEWGYSKGKGY